MSGFHLFLAFLLPIVLLAGLVLWKPLTSWWQRRQLCAFLEKEFTGRPLITVSSTNGFIKVEWSSLFGEKNARDAIRAAVERFSVVKGVRFRVQPDTYYCNTVRILQE